MKVSVSRNDAHAAFVKARRIINRVASLKSPILGSVLLSAGDDILKVTTTDLDRQITISIAASVTEPGKVCIQASTMAEALRWWPAEENVEIVSPEEGTESQCTVSCGRNHVRLWTFPSDDFPIMRFASPEAMFEIAGAELAEAISTCLPHSAVEDMRYYLNSVAIDGSAPGELTFVATNGHTLMRKTIATPEHVGDLGTHVVPNNAAKQIAIIAAAQKDQGVSVEFFDERMHVRCVDSVFTCRLIKTAYPDYRRIIPKDFAHQAKVSAKDLAYAAKCASMAFGKIQRPVRLDFASTAIRVSAKSERWEADSTVDAEFAGAPTAIGFNAEYLRKILAPFAGGTAVIQLPDDDKSPFVFTSAELDGVTAVLMPMRL